MKRFMQLMSAFSNWFENRRHALALHLLFCNCSRVHKKQATAAMAAGVVDRILDMEDCHCVTGAMQAL